jgi:hypothetical protein
MALSDAFPGGGRCTKEKEKNCAFWPVSGLSAVRSNGMTHPA